MKEFTGKIGIIGSGALGALYGARMARAGYDVRFLMRRDYQAVRQNGLKVKSFQGDFKIHPPVYPSAEELGPCDLLVIGLKTIDNAVLPEIFRHTTHENTLVLTLQNGLGNEQHIEAALEQIYPGSRPAERILGGVAFLCSNRIAPGVIHHMEYGRVRLAEFSGPVQDRTHAIAKLFEDAEFPIEVSDSLMTIRWEKLVWNVPFNGLGVAAGHADSQAVLQDDVLSNLAWELMGEVLSGARSCGVEIPGEFPRKLMDLTKSMGAYKSSMQIDYENGRPLEVEAILGEPYRFARRAGIDTPRMKFLYGVVRRLDQNNR